MNQRCTPSETAATDLPAPAPPPDPGASTSLAFSLALHVGVLLASALAMPALGAAPDATIPSTLQAMLAAAAFAEAAPPEEEEVVPEMVSGLDADGQPLASSRCGERRGGSMGDPEAAAVGHRYGVQGPTDNPDPHLSRDAASGDQTWETLLSYRFSGHWGGAPDAPVTPWGRDDSLGTDPTSARGEMWGDAIGVARGSPGAGLGRPELCETCGAGGRGQARPFRTGPAGATGTEAAHAPGGGSALRTWATATARRD